MFERFTNRARKILALANQEALLLSHEYLGTGHILLGLVKEGSGMGAVVLNNLGIDIKKLRLEIKKLVRSRPDMDTKSRLPQTSRAKKVIEYAIEEARSLNHNYVGNEHILLGLLKESEGTAAQILINLGLKLENVRQEILNMPYLYDPIKIKFSRRYNNERFTYWWDISPGFLGKMDNYEAVAFVKNDSFKRKFCYVPIPALRGYLTKERQTNRVNGNWGIKVLKGRVLKGEDLLAFEPGSNKKGKWLFLPVVWLNDTQDDRISSGR